MKIVVDTRDPDDDKFISCAIDAKALYIVSDDKDLLSTEDYEGIEIITAADFCNKYLSDNDDDYRSDQGLREGQ